MNAKDKEKHQLIKELATLLQRIAKLEQSETERKQAEKALQEEKNKLQAIVDAMEHGLTMQDRDYNIIYQNEVLRNIFGGLGGKCYKVYEGKNKICDGCPVKIAYEDGKPHTSERKVIMPSGEIAFWENTANPIRNAKGKIVSCLEIARNITERKQAEEERVKAVSEIINVMSDALLLHNLDGKVIFVNPAYEKMLGYKKSELVGRNVADVGSKVTKPGDIKKTVAAIETALKGTIPVPVPITLISKKGKEIPVVFTVSFMKDAKGKPSSAVVVLKDITDLKRTEDALQESEQWLSTTLKSIGDAVIATDIKGIVSLMNPVAENLTGWDESEAEGKPLKDVFNIINEQTGKRAENPVARVLREGVIVGLANHTALIAKDGTKRPIADSGAPIRDEEGTIIGTVLVFRDVTEQRKLNSGKQGLRKNARI